MINKKYQKNKDTCKVTFTLPLEAAPNAKDIRVVGDFNNWNWDQGLKMKATKTEYRASVDLDMGRRYEFRYLMDNTNWENDLSADDYVPSPFTGINNSVISLEGKIPALTTE